MTCGDAAAVADIMSRGDGPGLDRTFSDLDDLVSQVQETVKALQEENARLKKITRNQALELEFKTELFKKRYN